MSPIITSRVNEFDLRRHDRDANTINLPDSLTGTRASHMSPVLIGLNVATCFDSHRDVGASLVHVPGARSETLLLKLSLMMPAPDRRQHHASINDSFSFYFSGLL